MDDLAQAVRDAYPGRTYQDIARGDGDQLPPQLLQQRNPPQSTEDIPFARYTSRAFFDREMEKMWRRVWQYACREKHLPPAGPIQGPPPAGAG